MLTFTLLVVNLPPSFPVLCSYRSFCPVPSSVPGQTPIPVPYPDLSKSSCVPRFSPYLAHPFQPVTLAVSLHIHDFELAGFPELVTSVAQGPKLIPTKYLKTLPHVYQVYLIYISNTLQQFNRFLKLSPLGDSMGYSRMLSPIQYIFGQYLPLGKTSSVHPGGNRHSRVDLLCCGLIAESIFSVLAFDTQRLLKTCHHAPWWGVGLCAEI